MQILNAKAVKELLATQKTNLLDIRDGQSFARSHIEEAIHFDANHIEQIIDSLNKQEPLVVYCYHGISSINIAQSFEELGFQHVYSLEGGYAAWESK